MNPETPVEDIPQVGKYYAFKLKRLEIETVEDLIYHFPFRYDDFSNIAKIENINPNEKLTIKGVIWSIKNIRTRSGKFITVASVADTSGVVEVVWFNQTYLTKTLKAGTPVLLSGKVLNEGSKVKMLSPTYEIIRSKLDNQSPNYELAIPTLHTARLVPIYPETEGITSKWLRAKIAKVLPTYIKVLKDFLPQEILKRQNIATLKNALTNVHFPKNLTGAKEARKRLAFDELFLIQLAAQIRKKNWGEARKAPKLQLNREKTDKLISSLPFSLTSAQKKATGEILKDLMRDIPANRLLEGDVGSGKTVVAAIAAYQSYLSNLDTLIAAPTEILALQHQQTLTQILSPQGVKVGIWTGSKKKKGDITVGTHALLESFKSNREIGLVVVDEQHRFGVAQRAKLFMKHTKKLTPHLLTMTATPIPRTLALTIYGDLDLSVLDEMPLGRQKIATFVVPNKKRADAYKFIEKQIGEGRQTFIITPFVEPSETMVSVKSATQEFAKLKTKFSSKVKLGLLHGKLKSKEKESIINNFKAGKLDILVSTPVVEVGIDVPNATIMMIESADRFGLAQLHQLRGRVGRGKYKSYCLLFSDSSQAASNQRLKSMEKIHVGFELAQIDLKMRGAGDIFGFKQSGFLNLKIADITDSQLVSRAREEAKRLVENDEFKKHKDLYQKLQKINYQYIQPN